MRYVKIRLALVLVGVMSAAMAFCQDPPAIDWAAQATTIKNTMMTNVTAIFPVLLILFGLFLTIAVFRRVVKSFSK